MKALIILFTLILTMPAFAAHQWLLEVENKELPLKLKKILSSEEFKINLKLRNVKCLISTPDSGKNLFETRMIVCTYFKGTERVHQIKTLASCNGLQEQVTNNSTHLTLHDILDKKSSIGYLITLKCINER
jgi:hypothetical protein